jgi:hypothetical protein
LTRARIIDCVRTVPPNLASLSEPSRSTVKGAPGGGGACAGCAEALAEGDAPGETLADALAAGRFRSIECPVSCSAVTIAGMK